MTMTQVDFVWRGRPWTLRADALFDDAGKRYGCNAPAAGIYAARAVVQMAIYGEDDDARGTWITITPDDNALALASAFTGSAVASLLRWRKQHQWSSSRGAAQHTDVAVASATAPEVTAHHNPNFGGSWLRLKSDGYGSLVDGSVEDTLLGLPDIDLHYAGDAGAAEGYVGTWTAPLTEICYSLGGVRRYAYVATTRGDIDTWQQDWWVSPQRLTAAAAADAIVACRAMRDRIAADLRGAVARQ